jgi:DNA-binding response OmpR family regulator
MQPATKNNKAKVLIVDDDTDLLELLSDIMTNEGYKVITATDGLDGSFKFNNETFDIVLTDIKMPKKDGIKFVQFIHAADAQKKLKGVANFKTTPIILISASADEYRMEIEVLGNIEILTKPFSPKEVLEKVGRLLEKKPAPATSAGTLLSFKAGEYVMKEGEIGTDVFFVKEGHLKVTKRADNGAEVTVTNINAGEMIGEMGFLLHKNRSASVMALTDSTLLCIPKEKFEAVMAGQPKWFRVLFETITSRLEDTTKFLVEAKSKN